MTYGHMALDGMRPLGLPPFFSRFSDEELADAWRFSGLPGEYQGRVPMARFLEPIPASWRDIVHRALRTGDRGRALDLMLAILRGLGPRVPAAPRLPTPAPRALTRQHYATPHAARAP